MNAIPHLDAAASAPTVLEIVVGTPVWVWPVLALLLWRGWSATRERTVAAWQVWLMPAVFVVFALARLVEAGFASMALLGLAAGGALGIPVGAMIGRRFPIAPTLGDETKHLELSGSQAEPARLESA